MGGVYWARGRSGSVTAISEARPIVARDREADRRVVRVWLYAVAVLVVGMVVLGGATRLTGSGLSITEWKPIHGVIPPIGEAQWKEEFAKYREIPQFSILNSAMTLAEFQAIFWWEWAHRLLGRVIGVAVLVPLVFFWATGRLETALKPRLLGLFLLGGLQGVIGWWMVASGLSERVSVSQYRLAVHLTLACVILAVIVWIARSITPVARPPATTVRTSAIVVVALVFVQIVLGALVAGLDAGFTFNTWPLMDGTLVPANLLAMQPWWVNFGESAMAVQFAHRVGAYVLLGAVLVHALRARSTDAGAGAWWLLALVLAQAAIGIATLLTVVPLSLALLHQLGATVVLWVAVTHLRWMYPPLPIEAARA